MTLTRLQELQKIGRVLRDVPDVQIHDYKPKGSETMTTPDKCRSFELATTVSADCGADLNPPLKSYRVEWVIDIFDASSPRDAAQKAFNIMQKEGTTATGFLVYEHDGDGEAYNVDLSEPESYE